MQNRAGRKCGGQIIRHATEPAGEVLQAADPERLEHVEKPEERKTRE